MLAKGFPHVGGRSLEQVLQGMVTDPKLPELKNSLGNTLRHTVRLWGPCWGQVNSMLLVGHFQLRIFRALWK